MPYPYMGVGIFLDTRCCVKMGDLSKKEGAPKRSFELIYLVSLVTPNYRTSWIVPIIIPPTGLLSWLAVNCKRCALIERIITNTCYWIRNHYACKGCAFIECTIVNICYRIAYFYICKRCATIECIHTNTCYRIAYFYICKRCATIECMVTNTCYRIGYLYTLKRYAIFKCVVIN